MRYGKIQARTVGKCIARIRAQFGDEAVIIRKTPIHLHPWYRLGFRKKGWQIDYGIPEGNVAQKSHSLKNFSADRNLNFRHRSSDSHSPAMPGDMDSARIENRDIEIEAEDLPRLGLGKYSESPHSKFYHHIEKIKSRLQANELSSEFIQRFLHQMSLSLSQEDRSEFSSVLQTSVRKMTALIQAAPILFHGVGSKDPSLQSSRGIPVEPDSKRRSTWHSGRGRAILFCGPSGCGKSTSLAKLATEHALVQKKDISIFSLDQFRIGASQQLRAYAKVIEVPFYAPVDANSFANQLEMDGSELIFIDTFAMENSDNVRREIFLEMMQVCRDRVQLETQLVLAANLNHRLIEKVVQRYEKNTGGIDKIILSKLDEAEFIGAFVEIADRLDKAFSYFMTGPQIPSDMQMANAKDMAEIVLGIQMPVEEREKENLW